MRFDPLPLFARPEPGFLQSPSTPLERRFAAFHKANPNVYHRLSQRALELVERCGRKRIGIAELFEELRHDPILRTSGDEFKVNNSFRSLYARMLIFDNPTVLAGAIELRKQTSHNRTAK